MEGQSRPQPDTSVISRSRPRDHRLWRPTETRGRRADYVHSREDGAANARVMQRLNNHDLDVIVQVRKLGEGLLRLLGIQSSGERLCACQPRGPSADRGRAAKRGPVWRRRGRRSQARRIAPTNFGHCGQRAATSSMSGC